MTYYIPEQGKRRQFKRWVLNEVIVLRCTRGHVVVVDMDWLDVDASFLPVKDGVAHCQACDEELYAVRKEERLAVKIGIKPAWYRRTTAMARSSAGLSRKFG